jgi:formylglycine-generating enzyme required for sulfatase activity
VNSGVNTHPVGELRANAFGLNDMHGNVREWCADYWATDYYAESPSNDPSGPSAGSSRVYRGGSKGYPARNSRSANRDYYSADCRSSIVGFRLASVLVDASPRRAETGKPNGDQTQAKAEKAEPEPPPDPAAWKAILPDDAPAPAIAPFNAAAANKHQQAWADYLGGTVEQQVTLADGVNMTMVLIPPGEFGMGSTAEEQAHFLDQAEAVNDQRGLDRIPTEGPQHRVRLTRPFYLGKYEVTQAQWEAVMGSNPSQFNDDPSHPVEHVSWDDIQPFLAKLNVAGTRGVPSAKAPYDVSRMRFTLPTEAQWEYACRAGTTTVWHCEGGEAKLGEYAWIKVNSDGKTHPVGELLPNGFGLHDMHGNLFEWCADRWAEDYYGQSPSNDPRGPPTDSRRLNRGGAWSSLTRRCRSAKRSGDLPDLSNRHIGFRVALVLVDG